MEIPSIAQRVLLLLPIIYLFLIRFILIFFSQFDFESCRKLVNPLLSHLTFLNFKYEYYLFYFRFNRFPKILMKRFIANFHKEKLNTVNKVESSQDNIVSKQFNKQLILIVDFKKMIINYIIGDERQFIAVQLVSCVKQIMVTD